MKKVRVAAGHWADGSGASCPRGARAFDITGAVAVRVVSSLRRHAYRPQLLGEFDAALDRYKAAAFISLHADSCIPGFSGRGVARAQQSAVPEKEDRLVDCLYAEYEGATGVGRREGSISPDMPY